jgi:negative regulator of flagellin synthesis FlgM
VKIEKTSKPLPSSVAGEAQTRATVAKPAGHTPPSGADVHLGATSAQLRNMEASMANSPLVDIAKVAEIKQAISEGQFQVNSSVVADRLIETVKDLINSQKA